MPKLLVALIAAIAVHAPILTVAQPAEYIDPAGGYTQVVTVTDRGVKTIFVSGQVGEGASYRAHVESAFAKVVHRLRQAGATVRDVVKMRAFVTGLTPERYAPVADVRRATFPEGSWPASTVAGVASLARAGMQVEIEVVAVVAVVGAELAVERYAPSNGFSGAVAVTAHGVTTIYVAGQVGTGNTLEAQTTEVWNRIGQRLADAGATYGDLVKTTTYVVDYDQETDLPAYRDGTPLAVANLDDRSASTLLGIPALASPNFRVEIDGIAVIGTSNQSVTREFINPAGAFTQVVTVQGSGAKTVYISGQVGTRGDPLADQTDQVYANLRRQLEGAGAATDDLLNVTIYIPGYDEEAIGVLAPARARHGFNDDAGPASTLLGIQSLYASDAAIEIEGIAVVEP